MAIKISGPTLSQQFTDLRKKTAVAMNKAALATKTDLQNEIRKTFNKPTPYTVNSIYTVPSTADKLSVEIGIKTGARYLQPEIDGGVRPLKKYEQALRSEGILPDGMYTAPGPGAKLDAYGNLGLDQLSRILGALKAGGNASRRPGAPGARGLVGSGQRRTDREGEYVVIARSARAHGLPPGIYRREGRRLTLVIAFVRRPTYRARLDFEGLAKRRFLANFKAPA